MVMVILLSQAHPETLLVSCKMWHWHLPAGSVSKAIGSSIDHCLCCITDDVAITSGDWLRIIFLTCVSRYFTEKVSTMDTGVQYSLFVAIVLFCASLVFTHTISLKNKEMYKRSD